MDTTHDVIRLEAVAQAEGLVSRVSRERIASFQRVIEVGLGAGIPIDDIRDGIARQRGAVYARSLYGAPIAWSDASERDFCCAVEAVLKGKPGRSSRVLIPRDVEEWV